MTLTVCLCAVRELANSTEFTVRFPWVEFDAKISRVTVAFARMARFDRGGSGSMYAEREYERVQFVGLIVEVAMNPPQPSPPFASAEKGIPMSTSVWVQLPTTGRMLRRVSYAPRPIRYRYLLSRIRDVHGASGAVA